jgi:DNA-binding response OmpR family regulator
MSDQSLADAPSPIAGRALLVTSDAALAQQLKNGMRKFAVTAETCSESAIAGNLINTRKFEAIVVDLTVGQVPFAVAFLEKVRQSPSNHHCVTLAVADPEVEARVKSNFVLHKPLTEDNLAATLKAALDLIVRDYRRYFRCPVAIPVTLAADHAIEFSCETLNISEGGVALNIPVALKRDSRVRLLFTLPDQSTSFDVEAKVCWCDNRAHAGLEFEAMPPEDQQRLQAWLSRVIEKGMPEPIARFPEKQK